MSHYLRLKQLSILILGVLVSTVIYCSSLNGLSNGMQNEHKTQLLGTKLLAHLPLNAKWNDELKLYEIGQGRSNLSYNYESRSFEMLIKSWDRKLKRKKWSNVEFKASLEGSTYFAHARDTSMGRDMNLYLIKTPEGCITFKSMIYENFAIEKMEFEKFVASLVYKDELSLDWFATQNFTFDLSILGYDFGFNMGNDLAIFENRSNKDSNLAYPTINIYTKESLDYDKIINTINTNLSRSEKEEDVNILLSDNQTTALNGITMYLTELAVKKGKDYIYDLNAIYKRSEILYWMKITDYVEDSTRRAKFIEMAKSFEIK